MGTVISAGIFRRQLHLAPAPRELHIIAFAHFDDHAMRSVSHTTLKLAFRATAWHHLFMLAAHDLSVFLMSQNSFIRGEITLRLPKLLLKIQMYGRNSSKRVSIYDYGAEHSRIVSFSFMSKAASWSACVMGTRSWISSVMNGQGK